MLGLFVSAACTARSISSSTGSSATKRGGTKTAAAGSSATARGSWTAKAGQAAARPAALHSVHVLYKQGRENFFVLGNSLGIVWGRIACSPNKTMDWIIWICLQFHHVYCVHNSTAKGQTLPFASQWRQIRVSYCYVTENSIVNGLTFHVPQYAALIPRRNGKSSRPSMSTGSRERSLRHKHLLSHKPNGYDTRLPTGKSTTTTRTQTIRSSRLVRLVLSSLSKHRLFRIFTSPSFKPCTLYWLTNIRLTTSLRDRTNVDKSCTDESCMNMYEQNQVSCHPDQSIHSSAPLLLRTNMPLILCANIIHLYPTGQAWSLPPGATAREPTACGPSFLQSWVRSGIASNYLYRFLFICVCMFVCQLYVF